MLQVSGCCMGLVLMQTLRICMGLVLMYLQLILTPYANEWI